MTGDPMHQEFYLFPSSMFPAAEFVSAAFMGGDMNTDAGEFTEQATVTVTPSSQTRWSELEAEMALAGLPAVLKCAPMNGRTIYWITIEDPYGKFQVTDYTSNTMKVVYFSILTPNQGVLIEKGLTEHAAVVSVVQGGMSTPW